MRKNKYTPKRIQNWCKNFANCMRFHYLPNRSWFAYCIFFFSFFLCVLCCCCWCLYNVCLLSFDLDEIRPFSLHRSFLVLSWYELEAWVPRYNYTSKFKMLLCFQIQSKPICVLDTQQLLIVGIFCYACVKLQCRCCFSVFVCDVRRSNCHSVEFMFEMPSRGR